MRGSSNRQTVSSTARWNMGQSDPSSVGAQKKPVKNQQTGQGSNILQLKRALAAAQLHEQQTSDPRTLQNIRHGIELLKAQIARISGVDYSGVDVFSVPESATGYVFAGKVDGHELESTNVVADATQQSPISTFAQYQLWGTMRQRITKVAPPNNATPAGSLRWPGPPESRSNVIKTPNNPTGSFFPVAAPGDTRGIPIVHDTRDTDLSNGIWYRQDDPATHLNVYTGRGVVPSTQAVGRGKQGQYAGGYSYTPDSQTGG